MLCAVVRKMLQERGGVLSDSKVNELARTLAENKLRADVLKSIDIAGVEEMDASDVEGYVRALARYLGYKEGAEFDDVYRVELRGGERHLLYSHKRGCVKVMAEIDGVMHAELW